VLSCEQEAFVDRVPVTVFLGEESPLDAASGHVEDGVHKAFAIGWFSNVEIGSGSQKCQDSCPLGEGEIDVGHSWIFSEQILKINAA
jgi:hypothetical protein